jgi:hypothetical protein
MKRFISVLAVSSALAFAAGCSKTDTPPPGPTAAPATQPAQDAPPATPSPPPMPAPNAPKSDVSPEPKPGQANDHSSPAFKAGGKEATKEAPK